MRNKIFKFGIAVLTFSLGLGAFYLWYFQLSALQENNKSLEIETAEVSKKNLSEEIDPWKLPDNFPPLKEGEFFSVGHACGNGYVDGWLAYDESRLSSGFDPISPEEFQKEIVAAGKIIEKVEDYRNEDGKKGLRIILQGTEEETNKQYFSILWFGKLYGGNYGRYFINGPNLDISLELEKKLTKNSKKIKRKGK